jgi:hypothetical protein
MSLLHNARVVAGALLLGIALTTLGCSGGAPTAAKGTPEWTIQSASIAARQNDASRYVSFFTEERQREEIVLRLSLLTVQVSIREFAESEGPQSVQGVDKVLKDEIALLQALGKDWDWFAKTSKLDDDAEAQEFASVVAKAGDPSEFWAKDLRSHPESMISWGRIENVQVNGDTATATVYDADNPHFDIKLKLRRVSGEWKIDVR